MNNSVFRIDLDIHRQTTQEHLAVNKGDTARQIVASLSDGGRPYVIDDGCYAVFKAKKPDGNVLYNDCTIDNNRIVYEFTEQTASAAGRMLCELQLYGSDDKLITSPKIAIIVNGNVYEDSEVESSSEFTALAQAMTDLAELKANGLKGDKGDTGPIGPQGPQGESDVYYIGIEAPAGNEIFEDYNSIRQEYESGRTLAVRLETEDQETVILPLVKDNNGGIFHFAGVCDGVEWLVTISEDTEAENGTAVTVESNPVSRVLDVQISQSGESADKTFEEIVAAHEAGRPVLCHFQAYRLPLVAVSASALVFQCTAGQNYVRVLITPDGAVSYSSGKYVAPADLAPYALKTDLTGKQDEAPATDEIYFDITADGVISLKPEYRGACPAAAYADGVSDNGAGKAGTYNSELPEEIVIPGTVDGVTVTALPIGMFCGNHAVKSITIPAHITEIPKGFAAMATNLRTVNGTENVKVIGQAAFGQTLIEKVSFPNLESMDGKMNFQYCVNLVSANLGNNITALPEKAFFYCEKLAALRNTENVAEVGNKAFTGTKRLKTLPFASKLTSVGDEAFSLCRADYDWDSLTDCEFGAYATPNQRYATDFWTGRTFTECNTPMRSTFSQADPRWGSDQVSDIDGMNYADSGCAPTSAAMVWSVFEGKDVASPKEFEEAVRAVNPDLMSLSPGWLENLQQWFEALGYTAVHKTAYTAENVQAMYDALADGALVVAVVDDGDNGDTGDHAVVFHGINADGELRVVDPTSAAEMLGIYTAATYAMPIQSMASMYWGFLIVTKP